MIPSATDALAKFWKGFIDIKNVRQPFKQFDADNDGAITRQEVIQGMKVSERHLNNDDIDTLFIFADRDGDGRINFPESAPIVIPSTPERKSKPKKKYNNKAAVEQHSNHLMQIMMGQLMQKNSLLVKRTLVMVSVTVVSLPRQNNCCLH